MLPEYEDNFKTIDYQESLKEGIEEVKDMIEKMNQKKNYS